MTQQNDFSQSTAQYTSDEKEGKGRNWWLIGGVTVIGLLIVCFCCFLMLLAWLVSFADTSEVTSPNPTRSSITAVQPTATTSSPLATDVPTLRPTSTLISAQPTADPCEQYQEIERVQYAIESGRLECLDIFIGSNGVIVAPGNVGLDASVAGYDRDTIRNWLGDGMRISNPVCYGYARFEDRQQSVTFTDLAVNWESMIGMNSSDFSGITFVLDRDAQMPAGYALFMIIAEWKDLQEYWNITDPCR